MGKILLKRDRRYGCFLAGYNCEACGKTVVAQDFNWERNKIGIGEDAKIVAELDKTLKKKEINFCCKCGNKI